MSLRLNSQFQPFGTPQFQFFFNYNPSALNSGTPSTQSLESIVLFGSIVLFLDYGLWIWTMFYFFQKQRKKKEKKERDYGGGDIFPEKNFVFEFFIYLLNFLYIFFEFLYTFFDFGGTRTSPSEFRVGTRNGPAALLWNFIRAGLERSPSKIQDWSFYFNQNSRFNQD